MADAPQGAAAIARHDALRRILDHLQVVARSNRHDRVHLASDARIVDSGDGAGTRRDGGLDEALIDVQRVLAYVDEDWNAAPQHEGVGSRDERVGGHDDFIPRCNVQKQGRHLERSGAGMGQQGLTTAGPRFEPFVAPLRERAIAGKYAVEVRFRDVVEFLARHIGPVEGKWELLAISSPDSA